MAKPLAYWASSSATKEKSVITLTHSGKVMKLFFSPMTLFKKLEQFDWQVFSGRSYSGSSKDRPKYGSLLSGLISSIRLTFENFAEVQTL
jgi:hypothetical protein